MQTETQINQSIKLEKNSILFYRIVVVWGMFISRFENASPPALEDYKDGGLSFLLPTNRH